MWYRFFSVNCFLFLFFLIYWFRRTRLFVLLVLKTSSTERKEDEIRGRPAAHSKKQQHGFETHAKKLDPVTKMRLVSALCLLLISHALYYYFGLWRGGGWMCPWQSSSEGRNVKVGGTAFSEWIAPASDPWIRPALRPVVDRSAQSIRFPWCRAAEGEGGSAVHSLSSNQKCSFSNGKY